jgi:hypothetical protein
MNTRPGILRRVLLIAVAAAVLIGVTAFQSDAIVGRSYSVFGLRRGSPDLDPLPGARFIRSYPVRFNGLESRFGHYVSKRPAEEVIREYADRARIQGAATRPRPDTPALRATGSGCSTLSYATVDGTVVGIVAFDNRQTGGCEYFVGAAEAEDDARRSSGDCPGREPPGVARPPRSTRRLCLENLGGLPSVLGVYEAWGSSDDLLEDFRLAMTERGWRERGASSKLLTENYDGLALLSFVRGHEQCLLAIERPPRSGNMVVVVFWAERRWLPEGLAL